MFSCLVSYESLFFCHTCGGNVFVLYYMVELILNGLFEMLVGIDTILVELVSSPAFFWLQPLFHEVKTGFIMLGNKFYFTCLACIVR